MQVVVFDLEYGQPAASTTLPTSRPAFRDFLGCFGHADVGKGVSESGVDLLYTSHQVILLRAVQSSYLFALRLLSYHECSVQVSRIVGISGRA